MRVVERRVSHTQKLLHVLSCRTFILTFIMYPLDLYRYEYERGQCSVPRKLLPRESLARCRCSSDAWGTCLVPFLMRSLGMHAQSDVLSSTARHTLLDSGSLRYRRYAFKALKQPSCTGSICAAAAIAEEEACQMTRRDLMLLSTAMLSFQVSTPKVYVKIFCHHCMVLDRSDMVLKCRMPHAYAVLFASCLSFMIKLV